jgi:hypothetical protein
MKTVKIEETTHQAVKLQAAIVRVPVQLFVDNALKEAVLRSRKSEYKKRVKHDQPV